LDKIPSDQKYRDLALDPAKSFIVQAPAGAGKTTLLIQRYLKLLSCALKEPEECLAITFTRKAAAEMLSRVLAALTAAKSETCPTDLQQLVTWKLAKDVLAVDNKFAWNILENPHRLKIQTIDALCSSITAKIPIMTKFGCNVEIAEFADELYEKAAINLLTNENKTLDQYLNLLAYHLDNNQEKIVQLLMAMLADREKWLQNLIAIPSDANYMEYFNFGLQTSIQDAVFNANSNIPNNFSALLNLLSFAQTNLSSSITATKFCLESITTWRAIATLVLTNAGELRKTVTKQQGFPAATECKDLTYKQISQENKGKMLQILADLKTSKDFIAALQIIQAISFTEYTDNQQLIFKALLKILPVLVAHLNLIFQQQGKCDFTEVTLNSIQALGEVLEPSNLALILDHKIQHIMVDEFQDTSKSQFELLLALTRGWDGMDGKTIFLVGDPMQSIYRFRNADVGLFIYAKKYGVGDVRLNFLQLTANFRSTQKLVTWINNVFAASFPRKDDLTNGAISFLPSYAYKLNIIDTSLNVAIRNSTANEEAENITSYIKQLYQQNAGQTIAILVRSRAHLKPIINSLNMHGISFVGVDIDRLVIKPIVQDLLNLTNALLNLGDNLAWYSVLRSKWVGLELQDLQYLGFSKQQILWDKLCDFANNAKLSADAKIRLQRFVLLMQKYLAKLGLISLANLVFSAWRELGGLRVLQSKLELQASEQFFRFLESEENNQDIYNVDYLKNKLAKVYSQIEITAVNPVQIMTIHKAKGLEFDTVIVPCLAKQLRSDTEKLLLWQEHLSCTSSTYLLAAPIKSFLATEDPIYNYVKQLEQQQSSYEDLRVLYVALTRAKTNLYLSAVVEKDAPTTNSLLGLVWEGIGVTEVADCTDINIGKTPVTNELEFTATNCLQRIKTTCLYTDELVASKSHMLRDNLDEIISIENQSLELDPSREWMRHVGTLVHRELWRISIQGISSWNENMLSIIKKRWCITLKKLGVASQHLVGAVNLVAVAISNAVSCPNGRWILDHRHMDAQSEWSLSTYINGQIIDVVIDRSFVDADGIRWIIDYKTCDATTIKPELEAYTSQLFKYFAIVHKFCNESKIKTGLYFPLQRRWEVIGH
jgi:ATP-dependent helicase/nuclease subunit A